MAQRYLVPGTWYQRFGQLVKAISARVTGRVQGVGFRFNTAAKARELGISGWVRNAPDGAVEVWAQGDPDAIERFTRYLQIGPTAARVDHIRISPGAPNPKMTSFNVRY